jgi:hypothetical protein
MLDIRSITRKRKLGPDGRRREAKMMRELERELTEHVGGRPTVTQRELIRRAASLRVRLVYADGLGFGPMSEWDQNQYLRWHSSYVDVLKQIGPAPAPQEPTAEQVMSLLYGKKAANAS